MLTESFNGKGNIYEIDRYTRCALQNGIGAAEVISLISRAIDCRQYGRMVRRRVFSGIKKAELPLKFTDLEIEFIEKILGLDAKSMESLSKGCAKPATLRKAYSALLILEPVVVGKFLSKSTFDFLLLEICDYLGLDGYPPVFATPAMIGSIHSNMRLLLNIKESQ